MKTQRQIVQSQRTHDYVVRERSIFGFWKVARPNCHNGRFPTLEAAQEWLKVLESRKPFGLIIDFEEWKEVT